MRKPLAATILAISTLVFGSTLPAHADQAGIEEIMQARIDQTLADHPGGTQTAWNEISWDDGEIILTLASETPSVNPHIALLAVADCPSSRFCAYSAASYGGSRITFSTCTSNHSPSALGGPVRSLANSRSSGAVRAYNSSNTLLATANAGTGTNVGGTTTKLSCT